MTRVQEWLFRPVPEARVAVFRWFVYGFLYLDLLRLHAEIPYRAAVDTVLYQPLFLGRLLSLPAPTPPLVHGIFAALLVLPALALTGRAPRLFGWLIAVLYLEWMLIAFSYGKVDHDRLAFLLALFVLPTVGRASWRSTRPSAAAGWALRIVQIGVVATYFLAAVAKLRFGGLGWVNGATLARAVVRRGSDLAKPLLEVPWLLQLTQYGIMGMELASPLLLVVRERWQHRAVAAFVAFHLMTFAMISIMFYPHMLSLLAFLPLERITRRWHRPTASVPGAPALDPTAAAA